MDAARLEIQRDGVGHVRLKQDHGDHQCEDRKPWRPPPFPKDPEKHSNPERKHQEHHEFTVSKHSIGETGDHETFRERRHNNPETPLDYLFTCSRLPRVRQLKQDKSGVGQ